MLADYEDPNLDDFEEADDKATQVLKKKPEEQNSAEDHTSVFNKGGWTRDDILAAARSIVNKSGK